MLDIEAWAKQASEATKKMPHWEPDDGTDRSQWGSIIGQNRDATLLPRSNWAVVVADMKKRFPNDVEVIRFGHWGVGWVEEFFVRLWDAQGQITPAAEAGLEWMKGLEEYPIADGDHYYEMEYDATLHWIEEAGHWLVSSKAPKDWSAAVHEWFQDNDQSAVENHDDTGGYPSEAQMREALEALGWLEKDEED